MPAVEDQGVLERVAFWASGIDADDIPRPVTAVAIRSMLDLVASGIAAVGEPEFESVRGYLDGRPAGPASVIGIAAGFTPEDAAFANAVTCHALDFDDMSPSLSGHPTVTVLPAILAVAEEIGSTGAEVLAAFCVGVEVETSIGRMMSVSTRPPGWHPTAVLGVFGATAAVARLMTLDARRTAHALGLAAARAAGLKASFGTLAKPVQVGLAVRDGISCARLARAGFTANTAALEARDGLAALFATEGFDAEEGLASLGDPWDLADPGIVYKLHPCCGGTHSAIEAALDVRRAMGPGRPIDRVEIRVPRHRLTYLDRPHATDPLDRKFSLQFTVATALADGVVALDRFRTGGADIDELESRIELLPLSGETPQDKYVAEVRVTMTDGESAEARVAAPRGRRGGRAIDDAELRDKFDACVRGLLAPADRNALRSLIEGIEDEADLHRIGGLLGTVAS
jgi:2-methylcitrate dehydratase PrpD